jgi:hypothetical protein
MAGKGMGCATRGGGAIESGAKNKVMSAPSQSTGVPKMKTGGMAKKKPMGKMGGGMMMAKPYKKGGAAC